MSARKPRAAYCTGCDTLFTKMHLMMEHRRLERCGGRFLPHAEHVALLSAKHIRQYAMACDDPVESHESMEFSRSYLARAVGLRNQRRGVQ